MEGIGALHGHACLPAAPRRRRHGRTQVEARERRTIQRSLAMFGNLNVITGLALVAANAVLAQMNYSRPPLRRGVMRRSS